MELNLLTEAAPLLGLWLKDSESLPLKCLTWQPFYQTRFVVGLGNPAQA